MIGQKQLVEKINNLTFDNFNCPLVFIGPRGCGKKTLAKQLAKQLDIELVIIDEKISTDDIIEFQQDPIKKLYFIDLTKFNEKQQNQFLKFIEEPSQNVYIVLSTVSEACVLETILNRCIKYKFEDYSEEELQQITGVKSDLIYSIFKTPGQILSIDETQLKNLIQLCKFFVENYYKADMTATRLLKCALKINCKEEYSKFDFDQFFTVLTYLAAKDYYLNKADTSLDLLCFTTKYLEYLQQTNLSKENFLLYYLLELKKKVGVN